MPELMPNGMLHFAGFFPSAPAQINFELIFAPVDGQWRLFGIGANVGSSAPVAPPPPAPRPPKPAPAADHKKPKGEKPCEQPTGERPDGSPSPKSPICGGELAGGARPRWRNAVGVSTRPRGVRCKKPCCSK